MRDFSNISCLSSSCVLCNQCYHCLWVVPYWLPLQFSLKFIGTWYINAIAKHDMAVMFFSQSRFNEEFCIEVFRSCKLTNIEHRIINHTYNSPCDPFKSQLKWPANKNYLPRNMSWSFYLQCVQVRGESSIPYYHVVSV